MEKKIAITLTEHDKGCTHQFSITGISVFEAMGLLGFNEKKLFIDTLNEMEIPTPAPPSKSEGSEQDH